MVRGVAVRIAILWESKFSRTPGTPRHDFIKSVLLRAKGVLQRLQRQESCVPCLVAGRINGTRTRNRTGSVSNGKVVLKVLYVFVKGRENNYQLEGAVVRDMLCDGESREGTSCKTGPSGLFQAGKRCFEPQRLKHCSWSLQINLLN